MKPLNEQGLEVLNYWTMIEEGINSETTNENIKTKPTDIYTFCFTSGTTGPPKGGLITHANMMASTCGFNFHKDLKFCSTDVYLSYLPLPHLMERSISLCMFTVGALLV